MIVRGRVRDVLAAAVALLCWIVGSAGERMRFATSPGQAMLWAHDPDLTNGNNPLVYTSVGARMVAEAQSGVVGLYSTAAINMAVKSDGAVRILANTYSVRISTSYST